MTSEFSCIHCFFFILLLPGSLVAQRNGNVTLGVPLTAGDEASTPWLSPSEDFAFGFRQLVNKDLYLLAIWYHKIPDKTIVWYANGDLPAPKESKVELTAGRGLVLSNPQGGEIWKSGSSATSEAAYGFMSNTGNFLITNRNGEKLWQSFDIPTDTLLPTQIMEKGGVVSSRLSETNFSRGKFQFRLIPDGNAVLNTINLPTGFTYDAYFWSNTVDSNLSNAGYQVVFNGSGYLYVLRANNKTEMLTPGKVVPATANYHRATLHFDGVFVLYSHPKNSTGNQSWSVIRTMPDNICTAIHGNRGTWPCGFNGVCTLGIDQRAICECPQRFSPLDPDDKNGGWKPDFPTQLCQKDVLASPDYYEWVELTNVNWPESDYEVYTPYDIEECKKACLQDCICVVIVFGGQTCWKKKLPLSNGMRDVVNGISILKVRKGNYTLAGPPPFPYSKKNSDSLVLVVSVLLGGSVFLNLILVGVVTFGFLLIYHKNFTRTKVERAVESNLRSFSYKELNQATRGFKEEIGRGSFGIVYKGLIQQTGSVVPVAIKKLDRVAQERENELKTEVNAIAKTRHKNLVELIGFCDKGQHRMLVYMFLSNGSLASLLFGDTMLSWKQRTQIALEIAKGLVYLHEECSTQVIHCNIKPQNILLDDNYDARIADFGLAKLLALDQSRTFTAIRGTKGYVAPEWFRNMPITTKVDVYSFGVLLLEIICCRRIVDSEASAERAIHVDWVYDCYLEGMIHALVENDEEASKDTDKLERFVMVAIWCIQEEPNLRPTMKTAMLMLEDIIQVPSPPCPYPFSIVS